MTNKKSPDPAIIAALIGAMGTCIVAILTIVATRVLPPPQPATGPTWTPYPTFTPLPTWTLPPEPTITNTTVPTDTAAPGKPTSTPGPDTPTPEPTFTPAPPAIGSDWANGCISVLWMPYPSSIQTTAQGGCLSEPVNVFFAADSRLTFTVAGRYDDPQVFGMFAPLPSGGTVNIQAFLRNLQDGEIWVGIFAQPEIESQGVVIVIPPGDVRRRPLVQRAMPGQVELRRTEPVELNPAVYNMLFEFNNGTVKTTLMRNQVFDEVSINSTQQWLFVGYQVQRGNTHIDAEFLNLSVQGQ